MLIVIVIIHGHLESPRLAIPGLDTSWISNAYDCLCKCISYPVTSNYSVSQFTNVKTKRVTATKFCNIQIVHFFVYIICILNIAKLPSEGHYQWISTFILVFLNNLLFKSIIKGLKLNFSPQCWGTTNTPWNNGQFPPPFSCYRPFLFENIYYLTLRTDDLIIVP